MLGQSASPWKYVGKEQAWVMRPQFEYLEGEHPIIGLARLLL